MTPSQLRALVKRRQKAHREYYSGDYMQRVAWAKLIEADYELDHVSGGRWLGHHSKRAAFLKELGLSVGETK